MDLQCGHRVRMRTIPHCYSLGTLKQKSLQKVYFLDNTYVETYDVRQTSH